jgi:hypothetical protein
MGRLQNESSFTRLTDFITLNGEQYGEYSELHSYRRHLIEALGEHPRREEAAGTFIACLRDDPLPNVRNKAAQALGKVQSPETLNDLYVSFDREPHWVARQTILGSIGKIGNPNSVPFLEAQARNAREAAIRLSAAGALRHINTEHARSVLHELERSEPDPNVRKNITKFAAEADGKAADR